MVQLFHLSRNINFALTIFFAILFSGLYLHFAFRDIIQRVADVMKIYCFLHVAEAIAVSLCHTNHFSSLLSKINLTCCHRCQISLCFTCTGCDRRYCQGGREANGWCCVQLGGFLLHWVPHWSVFDVPCQNGHCR